MYAVEMLGITKHFKGFAANDHVDLRVKKGEIHSLLGENGAGKTTLMNILFGLYKAEMGTIRLDEKETRITSPMDAIRQGLAMVHQHFMLVDTLTVAENIVLGHEPRKGILFDREGAFREITQIAEKYHFQIDAREKVGNLSVGVKQRVEILKALYHNSSVLILDEPTAVLTPQEVEDLFRVLRELKADGKTIIIITHKLKETMEIADTVTVLRKGRTITSLPVSDVTEEKLAELMVGRLVSFSVDKKPLAEDRPVKMRLEHITYKKGNKTILNDLSLTVRGGEILGIAGVEGNGQTELIEVLTGILSDYDGTLTVGTKDLSRAGAEEMLKYVGHISSAVNANKMLHYVGHIPEDRGKRGFIRNFTNAENLILGYHTRPDYMNKNGTMRLGRIEELTKEAIETYDIRTEGPEQLTGSLSGGNQQKLIVARVLEHQTGIVLAAQPTRGVDIGAIEHIHGELVKLRDAGVAVILVSADLDEIVKLSDEIAVIYEGEIVTRKSADQFTETTLGSYMLGHLRDEEVEA